VTHRRKAASAGPRLSDFFGQSALGKVLPLARVQAVLAATGRASQRQRDLPAQVMVYYVVALALFMGHSYREVLRQLQAGLARLLGPEEDLQVASKAGISQARTRLGAEPLRQLYAQVVRPLAQAGTQGAWYRRWRLVSLDGSTLAVPDTPANAEAFGRPGSSRGRSGYPLLRFVSLLENGTHVLFGAALGAYRTGETTLAKEVVGRLRRGMLCVADRNFFSFTLWQQARGTGAHLLWRVKANLVLPCEQRLPDGSSLSTLYPDRRTRRKRRGGVRVRVIEYALTGTPRTGEKYRLLTSLLEWTKAPAQELAGLYPERWEIETSLDEFKTHLRGGAAIVLRSLTPELVRQEFWGFLLAHFVVRGLMHEAALAAGEDPDQLSFTHSLHVLRRTLPELVVFPPSAVETAA
jgi:hypothetical protein